MKRYIALVFITFLATRLFAQNGYKEYSWGMDIGEVKAKCPDLAQKTEDDFYRASIFAETISWKDGWRIVVWSMNNIDYRATGIEKVCYIDSEWLSPLVETAMAEFRKIMSRQKSRLD